MKTVLSCLLLLAASTAHSQVSPQVERRLIEFGEIVSVQNWDSALCFCPCKLRFEVVDNLGSTLYLCIGSPTTDGHCGFIAYEQERPKSRHYIEVGSVTEEEWIGKMYHFLDTNFTLGQIRKWPMESWGERDTRLEDSGWVLLRAMSTRDLNLSGLRWLSANFTKEEQSRIFNTEYRDLKNEKERQAYQEICHARGGQFWQKASNHEECECNVQ